MKWERGVDEWTFKSEDDVPWMRLDEDGTLRWRNGVDVGSIYQEVDGYYVYWPKPNGGFFESHFLRGIADLLDEMNAEWDKEIKDYFDAEHQHDPNYQV